MNLQQLNYILSVAELKHFGLAAARCYVTQSTLSTMIAKLESEIGIRIFDRGTKPVTITQEGVVLLDQMRVIAKEVENFNESVKGLKGEMSGVFNIGVIPTVAPYLLPRFLGNFVVKYPQIYFQVTELTTDAIIEKIKTRQLDIGIVALPLKNPELAEHPLYEEEFVLYDCSDDSHLAAAKIEEINKSKLCLLAEGHCMSHQIMNLCHLHAKDYASKMNYDFKACSIDSLVRFVRQHEGLTLLPYLATLDFSRKEKERISSFEGTVPVRSVGIVTHKHFVKTKLLDLLKKDIQKNVKVLLHTGEREVRVAAPV